MAKNHYSLALVKTLRDGKKHIMWEEPKDFVSSLTTRTLIHLDKLKKPWKKSFSPQEIRKAIRLSYKELELKGKKESIRV
jgi:hypothetical protein